MTSSSICSAAFEIFALFALFEFGVSFISSSGWVSSAFLFRDGAGSSTTMTSSSSPDKNTRTFIKPSSNALLIGELRIKLNQVKLVGFWCEGKDKEAEGKTLRAENWQTKPTYCIRNSVWILWVQGISNTTGSGDWLCCFYLRRRSSIAMYAYLKKTHVIRKETISSLYYRECSSSKRLGCFARETYQLSPSRQPQLLVWTGRVEDSKVWVREHLLPPQTRHHFLNYLYNQAKALNEYCWDFRVSIIRRSHLISSLDLIRAWQIQVS